MASAKETFQSRIEEVGGEDTRNLWFLESVGNGAKKYPRKGR
jgi:hypothetical protein